MAQDMGQSHQTAGAQRTSAGSRAIRPYEVRVDGLHRSAYRDLHDAIEAGKIAKRDRPLSSVTISNVGTGEFLMEVEA